MNFFKLFYKYYKSKSYISVDLDDIFSFVNSLDKNRNKHLLKKFNKLDVSKKIYKEGGYLKKIINKKFEKNTFGFEFQEYMNSMQDDLYKTSLKTLKYKNQKEKLFFEHAMLQHDLIHFLNEYDTSPLGEVMVLSNNLANEWRWSYFSILLASFFMSIKNQFTTKNINFWYKIKYIQPYIFTKLVIEGYKIGKKSKWLMSVDFDKMFNKSVHEVRKELNILPSSYWKEIQPLWLELHKHYKINN